MSNTKHPGPAPSQKQTCYWRECNEKRAAKGQPMLSYPRASPGSKSYIAAIAAGWKPEDGFPTGEGEPPIVVKVDLDVVEAPTIMVGLDPAFGVDSSQLSVVEFKGQAPKVLGTMAIPNTLLPKLDPTAEFKKWLGTPEGYSASDARLPTDPVRLGSEIDDRLRIAFLAGARIGGGK